MADHPIITTPQLFVLAGPNGAGKSTVARGLLPRTLNIEQFVNADNIAAGLSPFAPETTDLEASRIMLWRMHELLAENVTFAFETTLAGRTHAPFIKEARRAGYLVSLIFIWVETPELSISRVAHRVRQGGHHVPDETVRRRWHRGISNFFELYRPIAQNWVLCDNSSDTLRVIAQGAESSETNVFDPQRLAQIEACLRRGGQNGGRSTS